MTSLSRNSCACSLIITFLGQCSVLVYLQAVRPDLERTTLKQATESSICKCAGARLLDCSSNGTFINGAQASRSCRGSLMQDGDRLSLVLSVTPLVEHYFIYHAGLR